jgi:iron complex outermembrane receptor protein
VLLEDLFANEYSQGEFSDFLYNGFAQDQITIVPDRLQWYVGSKVEYSKVTFFNVQPSTRLLWTPDDRNSVWGAVSRSVRIPSLYQDDNLNLGGFSVTHAPLDPEQEISYEAGYKVQPVKPFTADVTGFYNTYHNLIDYRPVTMGGFPVGVLYANDIAADTYGAEVSANWQVNDQWRLSGSYSYLRVVTRPQGMNGSLVPTYVSQAINGSAPRSQLQFHSYYEIMKNLQANISTYYEDALPSLASPPVQSQQVHPYWRLDLGMAWQPAENVTLSAGVRNLLQDRHFESGNFNSSVTPSEVQREFYGECSIRF